MKCVELYAQIEGMSWRDHPSVEAMELDNITGRGLALP